MPRRVNGLRVRKSGAAAAAATVAVAAVVAVAVVATPGPVAGPAAGQRASGRGSSAAVLAASASSSVKTAAGCRGEACGAAPSSMRLMPASSVPARKRPCSASASHAEEAEAVEPLGGCMICCTGRAECARRLRAGEPSASEGSARQQQVYVYWTGCEFTAESTPATPPSTVAFCPLPAAPWA